ncbi:conserved hypothetical protein [Theileria orientalis strain Shintoku]|uniref:Uncharacterized protein n=1 Tax=Theileria orientalis strain Shintoku TaxID=869250 RepID=J4C3R4_THEOR|nr:conserved hypothetical protein [Theileria orientalis strain Shintoku]BAM40896.1 conserved hypothetical protein [Theileria orientalis strain Shintoku]|eukprot:XP_009691197.1 conserved hypothetical protein [Theileria orientalis strain Shintoku]
MKNWGRRVPTNVAPIVYKLLVDRFLKCQFLFSLLLRPLLTSRIRFPSFPSTYTELDISAATNSFNTSFEADSKCEVASYDSVM